MPLQNVSLWSKGIQYQILFSFKQSSSKQVFKALRRDESTGVEQEVLLKVFLKRQEQDGYRDEFESLSQMSHFFSLYCVRLFGFENFGPKKAFGVGVYQRSKSLSFDREFFFKYRRNEPYIGFYL